MRFCDGCLRVLLEMSLISLLRADTLTNRSNQIVLPDVCPVDDAF